MYDGLSKAVINLNNLESNYKSVRSKNTLAVVKANAYGHGATKIARKLLEIGCSSFCVANVEEAYELRTSLLPAVPEIAVLGYVPPDFAPECLLYAVTPTVFNYAHANSFARFLPENGRLKAYIAYDTGMNRKGIVSRGECLAAISETEKIFLVEKLEIVGAYTHFFATDCGKKGEALQSKQCENFCKILKAFPSAFSSVSLSSRHSFFGEDVRAGLTLYGYPGGKPVMKLCSVVVDVRDVKAGEYVGYGLIRAKKDMTLALVPLGYADGILQAYSGKKVKIKNENGEFYGTVFGRVCMDFTLIDVSEKPIKPGDEVVFFGDEVSQAQAIAGKNLPVHEVLTSVSSRVRRVYVE